MSLVSGLGFGVVKSALGSVPSYVWYAIAAFAVWWFASGHYIDQGREEVKAELRAEQIAAEKRARAAVAVADTAAVERESQNAAVISDQLEAIEQAERENTNALDAIF